MHPPRLARGVAPVLFLACSFLLAAPARPQAGVALPGERLAPGSFGPGRIVQPLELPGASATDATVFSSAPSASATAPADVVPPVGMLLGGGPSNAPIPGIEVLGPALFDAGNTAIPPDPGIAAGPSHLVTVVNRNVSVWSKANGARLVDVTLAAFFGAPAAPSLGNPRVVYDPHSERFVASASDLVSRIWLAVSLTSDPTAGWFTTSFVASQGLDAGAFPDYPLLGTDAAGIYVTARMYGGFELNTIFAIDKAPLVAPVPTLGAVTAFRGLPMDIAVQPCTTFASAPGQFFVSRHSGGNALHLWRIQGPMNAPTMSDLGLIPVPANSAPFTVPAFGSAVPLMIGLPALGNAVYHRGRIWATHHVSVAGRTAVRWYELDPIARTLVASGTIDHPVLHFYDPGIAVNGRGDLTLVFNGSGPSDLVSSWTAGHLGTDAAGVFSTPTILKGGESFYERLDGIGRNRWGNHNTVATDPTDPHVFWSFTGYARHGNRWGTWITKLELGAPGDPFCAGDGFDLGVDVPCPCVNFGERGHGCANSAEPAGALLATSGSLANDDVTLLASGMPATAAAVFLKGDLVETGGVPFGDGVRCAGGTLLRLGLRTSQAGAAEFPGLGDPTLSAASGTPVGSGAHAFYQTAYRNPAAAFCPPETLNATNATRVLW